MYDFTVLIKRNLVVLLRQDDSRVGVYQCRIVSEMYRSGI